MKNVYLQRVLRDAQSTLNAVPVALLIFFSICYLVLAANAVSMVNSKLLVPALGLALYVVLVALVRGVTHLWLQHRDDRERVVGHLVRGVDRIAFMYVGWTVVIRLFPELSMMASNRVMTSAEKMLIESIVVLYLLGSVYIVWYMVLGVKEKVKPANKRSPKIDN